MPRRLGLYGPFIALAIAAGAGSLGWLWLKGRAERALDDAAAAPGHPVSWQSRRIGGFPFHLAVEFTGLDWRDPSGWGIAVPSLATEASVFAPGHWVAVAPAGAVITRPSGGPLRMTAKVLRASLYDGAAHPPSFSLEALGATITPAPGAAPWLLGAAREIHLHTRAGPADQGAAYVEVDDGVIGGGGVLGALAGGRPMTLIADGIYGHAAALAGPSWAEAVRAWARAGGALTVRRLRLAAGGFALEAHGTGLTVGGDGRLEGVLAATLVRAPGALGALTVGGAVDPGAAASAATALAARAGSEPVSLHFQAGRTTLGPVALFPAPKVY